MSIVADLAVELGQVFSVDSNCLYLSLFSTIRKCFNIGNTEERKY